MIKFLRHLFLDDFLLKLFSLVLALLFWLTVSFAIQQKEGPALPALSLTPDLRIVFRLPVVVVSSAPDARKCKISPEEVDVTLQGDARLMERLQTRDIRAIVELTPGEAAHNLSKRVEVSVPAGVAFVRAVPDQVQIFPPAKN
jgi:hypothetical protein